MHLVGIVQSLGLFFVVCLATAGMLCLAMMALARMERATVSVRDHSRRPHSETGSEVGERASERVSSRGSCTYRPRGR